MPVVGLYAPLAYCARGSSADLMVQFGASFTEPPATLQPGGRLCDDNGMTSVAGISSVSRGNNQKDNTADEKSKNHGAVLAHG